MIEIETASNHAKCIRALCHSRACEDFEIPACAALIEARDNAVRLATLEEYIDRVNRLALATGDIPRVDCYRRAFETMKAKLAPSKGT